MYKLPKRITGKYRLVIGVSGASIRLGRYDDEISYWHAHAKMLKLFGANTKGLAFVKTLSRGDARRFMQTTMIP